VLSASAVLLAILSEALVGAIDPFIASFDLTPLFVGVILIPTIGNLSEHLVAVQLGLKNRVDFSMAVSIGSSLQVALFVAPVLVLLGLVVGQPMDLVFTPLEVASGALLLGVYAILAVSFFFLGS
jgi:Ca2+:H+ antiporter